LAVVVVVAFQMGQVQVLVAKVQVLVVRGRVLVVKVLKNCWMWMCLTTNFWCFVLILAIHFVIHQTNHHHDVAVYVSYEFLNAYILYNYIMRCANEPPSLLSSSLTH
jgi:hypothetical protein